MLLSHRVSMVDEHLCRECSRRVGRGMQSATLLTGWWGIFAMFRNALAVLTNSFGLLRAATMPSPSGGPISFEKERSVFARAQTWIGVGIVAGLVGLAAVSGAFEPSANWSVGSCVKGSNSLAAVPCSSNHDGKIVAQRSTSSSCPQTADFYVTVDGKVLCIDEDL
jgi:hypothetical protein